MPTMRKLVDDLRPSYTDTDNYIRLTTACFFVTAFFVVSGIVSMKEFSEYGPVRQVHLGALAVLRLLVTLLSREGAPDPDGFVHRITDALQT